MHANKQFPTLVYSMAEIEGLTSIDTQHWDFEIVSKNLTYGNGMSENNTYKSDVLGSVLQSCTRTIIRKTTNHVKNTLHLCVCLFLYVHSVTIAAST